jgi:MarR family transcriptional regulator, organic hydroperoxide resistance regulator
VLVADWQHVTHRLLAALDDELSDLGLTAAEVNALAAFAGATSRTVRELVDATGQRPSTFTGVLDRLERRGLIERRPNPADRRSILVALRSTNGCRQGRCGGLLQRWSPCSTKTPENRHETGTSTR